MNPNSEIDYQGIATFLERLEKLKEESEKDDGRVSR